MSGIHFVNIVVVSTFCGKIALSWGKLPCPGSCPLPTGSPHPMTVPCGLLHTIPMDIRLQRLHLGLAEAPETKLQPNFSLCALLLPSHIPQIFAPESKSSINILPTNLSQKCFLGKPICNKFEIIN